MQTINKLLQARLYREEEEETPAPGATIATPPAEPTAEEQAAAAEKEAADKQAAEEKAAYEAMSDDEKKAFDEKKAADEKAAYDAMSDEEKKAFDEKKAADEKAALRGAPEGDYDAPTLPEGVELNEEALAEFLPMAKDLDLSQAGLQKMVDFQVQLQEKQTAAMAEAMAQEEKSWLDAIGEDAELGGDDQDKKLANVSKAVETFATPEFAELMNTTRLGNNPEMVRFLKRVGDAIGEDSMVNSKKAGQGQKSAADTLYPPPG